MIVAIGVPRITLCSNTVLRIATVTAESNTDHDHGFLFSVRRSAVTDGFLTLFVRKGRTVTCKDL